MRIYQQPLAFNDAGSNSRRRAETSWDGQVGEWFYVEHKTRDFECLYADEKGNFYYSGKEFSRVVPVVWNLRREAARVARGQNGKAKKYPYRLKSV